MLSPLTYVHVGTPLPLAPFRQRPLFPFSETILFTGIVTNFCCETSARDAMMLGYRAVMVSDGNAARHEDDHLAELSSVIQSCGDVRPTDEVIQMSADY